MELNVVTVNKQAPKILNDIVAALSKSNLKAVTDNNEGRVNSKQDEDQIIAWLQTQPEFKDYIVEGNLRGFGDMEIKDPETDELHIVNIKTSVGSSDNAFSKIGLLWAFTDLTYEDFEKLKIAKKISDGRFAELVVKHKKETPRDYWYLSLDKNNFSNVMVRGVKQINHWGKNPTNNLQIMWGKEHESEPNTDSFDKVFENVITNGVFYCWYKKSEQWLKGIALYEATKV